MVEQVIYSGDKGIDPLLPGQHRVSVRSIASALLVVAGAVLLSSLTSIIGAISDAQNATDGGSALVALLSILGPLIIVIIAVAVFSYVSFRFKTYEFTEKGFIVRTGWLVKKQLTVSYQKVHTVDIQVGVIQRVMGLANLQFDTGTGGSGGGENKLNGLRSADAEIIRRELMRRKALAKNAHLNTTEQVRQSVISGYDGMTGAPLYSEVEPIYQYDQEEFIEEKPEFEVGLSNKEYILTAISDFSVGALVVSVLTGLSTMVGLFALLLGSSEESVFQGTYEVASGAGIISILVGLILIILVVWVLSTIKSLLKFGGFALRRYEDNIQVGYGVISRSQATVAYNRIQVVEIIQSPIRRLIGYAEVKVQTVRGGGASGGSGSNSDSMARGITIHPFIKLDQVEGFVATALPGFAYSQSDVEYRNVPKAARRRSINHGIYWALFGALVIAAYMYGVNLLISGQTPDANFLRGIHDTYGNMVITALCTFWFVINVLQFIGRILGYRIRSLGHTDTLLVIQDGGYRRTWVLAYRNKIQSLTVKRNPFQRHAGVATCAAKVASSTMVGLPLKIKDLGDEDAVDVQAWLEVRQDRSHAVHEALREAAEQGLLTFKE